jgi:hypothetical protein
MVFINNRKDTKSVTDVGSQGNLSGELHDKYG